MIILSTIVLSTYAQDFIEPDFQKIKNNTNDASSSYHYPKLMAKYLEGTSEMTPEEGRHLYFGYVYQDEYIPTDTSDFNSKLANTLSRGSFTQSDYAEILEYSDALLSEDPFNLRALNAKMLVYAQLDDTEAYRKVAQKRQIVQNAIIGTGDGMSERTPFYVIKVAHEYDILPFLGYTFGGEDKILRNNKVNYLSLGKNRFGVERVYFNISPVIEHISSHGGGRM